MLCGCGPWPDCWLCQRLEAPTRPDAAPLKGTRFFTALPSCCKSSQAALLLHDVGCSAALLLCCSAVLRFCCSAVGCWLLAVGCWLLAVGCWLLAVGCWLFRMLAAPPPSASACGRSKCRRFGCRRTAKLRALTCGICLSGALQRATSYAARRYLLRPQVAPKDSLREAFGDAGCRARFFASLLAVQQERRSPAGARPGQPLQARPAKRQ